MFILEKQEYTYKKEKIKDHSDSTTKSSNYFASIPLVFVYVNSLHLCKRPCVCKYITTDTGSYSTFCLVEFFSCSAIYHVSKYKIYITISDYFTVVCFK